MILEPAPARAPEGEPPESDADEQRILASVEEYLARGIALKRWWDEGGALAPASERFPLGRTFNRPDESFGFFGVAPVAGAALPVMGNFQGMFYDQPKSPQTAVLRAAAAAWMRRQLREFVLNYFMRISSFRPPAGYADPEGGPAPPLLRPVSWCPQTDISRQGFGFSQLFYKLRDGGVVGRFPDEERSAIVDLREMGTKYEWIVLRVRIFDFTLTFKPLGPHGPQLVLPLHEDSLLVVSRDFVVDQDDPAPGVLGRYGFGYAFIKNPRPGLLAYGPGEFDAAFETIFFSVLAGGVVRVEMAFVANRPERILNLSLNPAQWGLQLADLMSFGMASRFLGGLAPPPLPGQVDDPVFGFITLANLLSAGQAAQTLCISRSQLEKDFLVVHFMQHYNAIAGSLLTWRQVADWLNRAALPEWVVSGKSS